MEALGFQKNFHKYLIVANVNLAVLNSDDIQIHVAIHSLLL